MSTFFNFKLGSKTKIQLCIPEIFSEIDNISKSCAGLRRMGAASIDLAFVAAGKLDAYWEKNLNLWDVSSGILLVREAGGKISQPNGEVWSTESKDILASNLIIHNEMEEKLKTI